jgi:hypothetical protein
MTARPFALGRVPVALELENSPAHVHDPRSAFLLLSYCSPIALLAQSVSMSNWTMEEVNELKAENGGGNVYCRRTWLAGARPGDLPSPGDPIEKIKAFVNKACVGHTHGTHTHS